MKTVFILLVFLQPVGIFAQIGVKAGLNFANITKVGDINNKTRTGFHAGIFLAPGSKGVISSRTELIFSRQGYNFKTARNEGSVTLDYIMLPQLMGVRITKYVQVQIGAQFAYLLNAKSDSSGNAGPANLQERLTDYINRFDYGLAGGAEIYPLKGLLVGARLNVSLGELYKSGTGGPLPAFIPDVKVRNNLVQLYLGWRFGKGQ